MSVPSSDDNPPLWRTLESSNATKKEVLEPYDINSPLYTSDSEIIKAITRDMIEMIVHVVESNASTKQVWSLENLENDAIRNIKFEFTYKNKNIKNHYSFPNHYTNIRENYKSQTRGISNSRRRNHGRNLSTNSNAKTYKHILTASKQLKFSINKGKKWLKDEHNIEHQSEFQHRSELNAESNARCSSNLKVVSEAYKTLSSPLLSCEKNVSTLKDERCFDISSDEDPNELIICEQSQVFAHSGFKLQNTSTKQNIESSTVLPACNEHHTRSTENIHATEKSGRTKRNVSLNVFQCDTNTCVLNSETKNVKNEEHQLKTQGEGVQNDKKINPFFTSCEKLCLENTRNVLRRKCSNCQELLQKYTFKEKHHTFDDNVDFRVNNYKNEPNDHHLVNEVSLSSSDDSVFTNDRIHNESGKATPSPSLEETMLTNRNSQSPNEDNHRPMKASNAAENRSKSINFKQHSNTIHSLFCEPQDEAIDLSKRRNSGTDVSKKTDESHSSSSQSSVFEESNVESSSLVPRNIETEIEVFCQKIKKSRNERNGEKSEDFDQSFKDELLSTYQRKSCLQFIRERMEVLRNEIFDLDSKAIEKQREKLLILQHRKRKQEKLNRIEKQQEIISQVRRLRLSKQPSRALQFADPHCEISETCIRDFTELETPLSRDDNVAQVLCSNSDQQSALHNLLLTKRDHSKNMKKRKTCIK
ncbi:uncharacterized protein LOC143255573 isoform X2 [Tachypleus tridentatus]|uniref:uncharacterized protein LOC143255573 isoform X2 n=1 Tax=Tachypleus tridentatus TaxID=6853 RepID=UPI003FD442EB